MILHDFKVIENGVVEFFPKPILEFEKMGLEQYCQNIVDGSKG